MPLGPWPTRRWLYVSFEKRVARSPPPGPQAVSRRRIRAASRVGPRRDLSGKIALIRIRHIMEHFVACGCRARRSLGDARYLRCALGCPGSCISQRLSRPICGHGMCFAGIRRTRGLRERRSHSHRRNDQCLLSASSGYAGSTWTVLSIQRWQRHRCCVSRWTFGGD